MSIFTELDKPVYTGDEARSLLRVVHGDKIAMKIEKALRVQFLQDVKKVLSAGLQKDPDDYTVQNCAMAYGGSSAPRAIKDALKCHQGILRKRILAMET